MRTRSVFLIGLAMVFALGTSRIEVNAEEESINSQANDRQEAEVQGNEITSANPEDTAYVEYQDVDKIAGIVENNSRAIFFDMQGNEITSANPGDTVYVEYQDANIDISNIPQANGSGMKHWWMEPTELLNKEYTCKPILKDLDGDRYPSWHDGSYGGLYEVNISPNITCENLYARQMIGITFYDNNADTWVPNPSQKGSFGDVDVWEGGELKETVKGFWIPMESEFSLTINVLSNRNDNDSKYNRDIASEEIQETQPSDIETAIMDKVQTLNGQVLASTVGGIYSANSVNGIAVTTEYASVASAAGLSAEQMASGANVRFYFCDSYVKEERAALGRSAEASGKQVAAYINSDMYIIDKAGKITRVRETAEGVTLVLGIPKSYIGSDYVFSLIGIKPNGETVILEDSDMDPNTITVNTQFFGAYALTF